MTMRMAAPPARAFSHEALFYSGEDEFLAGTSRFIRDGVRANEPILVVVSDRKIDGLRDELGPDAERVHFADMADIGLNPARIIPAWSDFVEANRGTGRPFRGIGEPIWAERTPEQLVECERHESLLNVAFQGSGEWRLLCPYDVTSLAPAVLEEAERNHPVLLEGDTARESDTFRDVATASRPFDLPLPPPPGPPDELAFGTGDLRAVRAMVARHAAGAGLDAERTANMVLAANEIATNSIRYGDGQGRIRLWREPNALICEVSDAGKIENPLIGRRRPVPSQQGGFGVYLATQVCDLVQVRTFATGSVVRLHIFR